MDYKMNIKRVLIILSLLVSWIYIGWRFLYTLPTGWALIAGLTLVTVELILIIQSTLNYIILFKPTKYAKSELPKVLPTVDIFIATYNESSDVLTRTILGCKNIEYDKEKMNIWLCDDGRRAEARKLAEKLGIKYLDRPTNEHAKAGNLNNAMAYTNGELVVTLDADMVPKPNFLKHTVGFFNDQNVAFVQTPQSFFNEDIFQYNSFQGRNIPNEQDNFMQNIQSGRDRFNAAIYVGSNTIFSRTALDSVGGFATGTITEDMATGMLLQAKGYKTIAYSEVLAQGLAPESLDDLISQRIRWARGNIQTIRKWNPLTLKGLTAMQRLLYLGSASYWYFGLFKMIFILSPIVYLLFGVPFLNTTVSAIMTIWLPYFLFTNIANYIINGRKVSFFWSNIQETILTPSLAWAVLVETILKKPIKFKVTPKGIQSKKEASLNKAFLKPASVLLFVSLIAAVKGVLVLIDSLEYGYYAGPIINLFWICFNIVLILCSFMIAYERPRDSQAESFERDYEVDIVNVSSNHSSIKAKCLDVFDNGCTVMLSEFERLDGSVKLIIHGKEGEHELEARLTYYNEYSEGYKAQFTFFHMPLEQTQAWVREVYGNKVNEEDIEYGEKSGMVYAISKYIFSMSKLTFNQKQLSPKFQVSILCLLTLLPEPLGNAVEEVAVGKEKSNLPIKDIPYSGRIIDQTEASIVDISTGGCQISLPKQVEMAIGSKLDVFLPESNYSFAGEIIQVNNDGEDSTVDVQFLEEDSRELLYDKMKQDNLI
ncbi:glycosyltransferase family 2 protein [Metabacillus fastidiosus]|uniref:glycosyltransferase family 2 protein n=1 Tax=Metabacillus fastidiosus TaxID=1458 RepID=UPI003D2D9439